MIPALLALCAAGLLLAWRRDQRVLAAWLQAINEGVTPGPAPFLFSRPVLDAARGLADTMEARAALVDRLLRAEESIVERLPDPLIVLGAGPRRVAGPTRPRAPRSAPIFQSVLRHPELRAAIDRAMAGGASAAPPQTAAAACAGAGAARAAGGGGGARFTAWRAAAACWWCCRTGRARSVVERMRADFVANASHELRTPLASLIGFIATLRGPAADDPPAQARFLEIMAEQAERMNRLIDDLLSLSRIEITEHQAPSGAGGPRRR